MRGMFADEQALEEMIKKDDQLAYEFYEMNVPDDPGDLAFGTSICYPCKVGNEYFMTKGHFYSVLETAEIYLCMKGKGIMLMENLEGDWDYKVLAPRQMVYVPKRYAHRSINIGREPFIQFFCFRADAGHDYGTIETKGYRKLIVEKDGDFAIIDNPKWKR
ncbi:MAG: glucose-6-phosphate isomerase family protein [Eubacteriales bacterium]|nr:glucose-6-phosphate isomerase family protein [Eubacteriales bacterium]